MGQLLEEAFKRRIANPNLETYQGVVQAFFKEYLNKSQVIVPVSMAHGKMQPCFLELESGKVAISVITDLTYLNDFAEQSYITAECSFVIDVMKDLDVVAGIYINPTLESRCYLPKDVTLDTLKQLKVFLH